MGLNDFLEEQKSHYYLDHDIRVLREDEAVLREARKNGGHSFIPRCIYCGSSHEYGAEGNCKVCGKPLNWLKRELYGHRKP